MLVEAFAMTVRSASVPIHVTSPVFTETDVSRSLTLSPLFFLRLVKTHRGSDVFLVGMVNGLRFLGLCPAPCRSNSVLRRSQAAVPMGYSYRSVRSVVEHLLDGILHHWWDKDGQWPYIVKHGVLGNIGER